MNKCFLMIIGLCAFFNTVAHATISEKATITMIRGFNATSAKGVYLTIDKAIPNPNNCGNTDLIRAADSDIVDFDQQFSLLLAAFMGGENCRNTYRSR